jgi:hypothetical protein
MEANVKNYDIRQSDTGVYGDLIGVGARATHQFDCCWSIATLGLQARQRSQALGKAGTGVYKWIERDAIREINDQVVQ